MEVRHAILREIKDAIRAVYEKYNTRGEISVRAGGSGSTAWVGEGPAQPADVYTLVQLKIGEPHE